MKSDSPAAIEKFRRGLDPGTLETVDALRAVVAAADDRLVEDFKWNAPSFRVGAEHRVTLGLQRTGGVRLVLHRGVATKDTTHFAFEDVDGLAQWPSKDRGVVTVENAAQVLERQDALHRMIKRWIDAAA